MSQNQLGIQSRNTSFLCILGLQSHLILLKILCGWMFNFFGKLPSYILSSLLLNNFIYHIASDSYILRCYNIHELIQRVNSTKRWTLIEPNVLFGDLKELFRSERNAEKHEKLIKTSKFIKVHVNVQQCQWVFTPTQICMEQ